LLFGGVVIAGICRFHSSLREVILVQLILMAALFILVAIPFLVNSLTASEDPLPGEACQPVRLIRRVSEDEVIAEFLKSDFHLPEFRDYHHRLRDIVAHPHLEDAGENAKRRALFFLRHLSLWRELPAGTEWYEVEVDQAKLSGIRVFPRAQWLRLARGNFSITQIAERMRTRGNALDAQFLAKIAGIGERFARRNSKLGAVIFIGRNENAPLTILDGNHRMVAALLASPCELGELRFLCGLSHRMTECCWYKTNLTTLLRYGRNVLTSGIRKPEAELMHLLHNPESDDAVAEA
jgi:hypothetical protein